MRALSILLYIVLLSGVPLVIRAAPITAATTAVEIAGHHFKVEIADTEAARERGLMFRIHMASDHGMLFVYPDAQPRTFWMKNTLIPLDILFFDADKRLINISADTPPCKTTACPTYSSTAPAQYVLELNSGMAGEFGIKPGDVLGFAP
ncbi:MAG TPA: DUF192 domain-containing protein [Gammaproteobacteria bacterium]|nr:DUF192 domain-containing protein [Gammaproteobacteria bacterium]